jgi:hypothetical protein
MSTLLHSCKRKLTINLSSKLGKGNVHVFLPGLRPIEIAEVMLYKLEGKYIRTRETHKPDKLIRDRFNFSTHGWIRRCQNQGTDIPGLIKYLLKDLRES